MSKKSKKPDFVRFSSIDPELPRRPPVQPKTLPNTKIRLVKGNELIPGNVYLIQYYREGTTSVSGLTRYQPEEFITRFRGKFVEYQYPMASDYPEGLPGAGGNDLLAIFENVEIISDPSKTRFPPLLYILKPVKNEITAFDRNELKFDNNEMRKHITDGNRVAFNAKNYYFAPSLVSELTQDTINKLSSGIRPLESKVFNPLGPGQEIRNYLNVKNGGKRRITRKSTHTKRRTIKSNRLHR